MVTLPIIPDQSRVLEATATPGQTDFSIVWPVIADSEILAKDDLQVIVNGAELTPADFDFTGVPISGTAGMWNGGTVSLNAALSGGQQVKVYSCRTPRRTGSFLEGKSLPFRELDKLMDDVSIQARDSYDGFYRALTETLTLVSDVAYPPPVAAAVRTVSLAQSVALGLTLQQADDLATASGYVLSIDRNISLGADTALNAREVVFEGGVITLGNFNLTGTSKAIRAQPVQIFAVTGTGRLLGSFKTWEFYPEWFGGYGDGTNAVATTTAIQYVETHLAQSSFPSTTITFLGTRYALNGSITKPQSFGCSRWYSPVGAEIYYPGIGSIPARIIIGGSGPQIRKIACEGLVFTGDSSTIAIENRGQGFALFVRCRFKANALGIWFHNQGVGAYTEFSVAEDCAFEGDCRKAAKYEVGTGNQSFHGSGLRNCAIAEDVSETSNKIEIHSGIVYNAPMSIQVWKNTDTPVFKHTGDAQSYFVGDITFENFQAAVMVSQFEIVDTAENEVTLIGSVASLGQGIWGSNLRLCDRVQTNTDGTITFFDKENRRLYNSPTGTNLIWRALDTQEMYDLHINIVGTNYFYSYDGFVYRKAGSTAGSWTQTANLENTDPGVLGAPVIAWNSASTRLQVTVPTDCTVSIVGTKRQVQAAHRPEEVFT